MNLIKRLACILAFGLSIQVVQCTPPSSPPPEKKAGTNTVDFNNMLTNGSKVQACFQPKIYQPTGYSTSGNDLEYVYFRVAQTDEQPITGEATFCDAKVDNKIARTYNIYFPADGSQPTTQNAAQYSCANIGAYKEDHPVTKWYIKAFGGDTGLELAQGKPVPGTDTAPKLGFDTMNRSTHIITVNPSEPLTFRQGVWQTFRTIAANPVGRVLLYRILIEIRRKGTGGQGGVGDDVLKNIPSMITNRNKCRSISIKKDNNNAYSSAGYIKFMFDNTKETNIVSDRTVGNSTEVIRAARTSDIGLFHEMLHWFHFLRDLKRYSLDGCCTYLKNYFSEKIEPGIMMYYKHSLSFVLPSKGQYHNSNTYIIDIANHHYDFIDKDDNKKETSVKPWSNDYEELRTILGSVNSLDSFRNGDELSENLYRLSTKNSGMRFGHVYFKDTNKYNPPLDSKHAYFEDKQVVEKQQESVSDIAKALNFATKSYSFPPGTSTDPNILKATGLGGCKIR